MVNVYEIRPGSYATVAEAKEESGGDVTKAYVDAGLATKQDQLTAGANITIVENVISATGELASTEWGEISGSMSAQTDLVEALGAKADSSSLATVATSGSYNDLSDKPTIPSVTGLATETYVDNAVAPKANSADLATVATTGAYADLSGKPTIPDITGLATETYVNNAVAPKANSADLATVATTGSYNDLSDKPTIPAAQVNSDWNAVSGVAEILNKPTIPSGAELVPSTTGASQGDVLTVGANGPEWAAGGGGSAPSNMATTDTAQNITGIKTIATQSTAGTNNIIQVKGNTSNDLSIKLYSTQTNNFMSNDYDFELISETLNNRKTTLVIGGMESGEYVPLVYGDPGQYKYDKRMRTLPTVAWIKRLMPEFTITGDGTTTQFSVAHSLGKKPGIVQITDSSGVVIKDSEITITKSTTDVVVTFTTAPADQATYTVAMLY